MKKQVSDATGLIFFRIGNVQLYERNRNKLNLIIIPASIGFIIALAVMTFCLRRMRFVKLLITISNQTLPVFFYCRYRQKHRHIVSELQKKKEASLKKALIMANTDPQASDKQRLLQVDSNVVGNVSDTMGSSKAFTKEPPVTRPNVANTVDHRFPNRDYSDIPPPIPSKENRPPYHNRDDESSSFQTQRSFKSSRERMHVSYEGEARYSPTHLQYFYETTHPPEMLLINEQQPRVIVRSVRDPMYEDSSKTFVSIPIQVEHSTPHQRFIPPPYHSDPYYPHANT